MTLERSRQEGCTAGAWDQRVPLCFEDECMIRGGKKALRQGSVGMKRLECGLANALGRKLVHFVMHSCLFQDVGFGGENGAL